MFYENEFHGLHKKCNYQLHHLLLDSDEHNERMQLPPEEVSVLHFSTSHKPSNYVLKPGWPDINSVVASLTWGSIQSSLVFWGGVLVAAALKSHYEHYRWDAG